MKESIPSLERGIAYATRQGEALNDLAALYQMIQQVINCIVFLLRKSVGDEICRFIFPGKYIQVELKCHGTKEMKYHYIFVQMFIVFFC